MSLVPQVIEQEGFAPSRGPGNYLNPSSIGDGEKCRFTILGKDSICGYQCWGDNAEGKGVCMRFSNLPDEDELQAIADENNAKLRKDSTPRRFLAYTVWNYETESIQIFLFTQQSIANPLIQYLQEEEIAAEPHTFDFVLSATGSGLDKRYNITALPGRRRKPDLNAPIRDTWAKFLEKGYDLSMILVGGDPFKGMPF